jgi:hypothetical protein
MKPATSNYDAATLIRDAIKAYQNHCLSPDTRNWFIPSASCCFLGAVAITRIGKAPSLESYVDNRWFVREYINKVFGDKSNDWIHGVMDGFADRPQARYNPHFESYDDYLLAYSIGKQAHHAIIAPFERGDVLSAA